MSRIQNLNGWCGMTRVLCVSLVAVFMALVATPNASATPLHILYYGNSFTLGSGGTRSIPELVSDIAQAGGHDAPIFHDGSVDGLDLGIHLQYNTGIINSTIAPGDNWDFVVMQDHSLAPTHLGDVTAHVSNAVGLYNAVAARSPNVTPVLFETWARAPGNELYEGPTPDFPGGPTQMQQEVRNGYLASSAAINAEVGSNLARVAWVGSAFESTGFDLSLYSPYDLYHAQNRGVLLAALVVYSSIYGTPPVSEIDLSGVLDELELTPEDGLFVAMAAGLVVPEPSSFVLLGSALAGLALWRLKRR